MKKKPTYVIVDPSVMNDPWWANTEHPEWFKSHPNWYQQKYKLRSTRPELFHDEQCYDLWMIHPTICCWIPMKYCRIVGNKKLIVVVS